MTDDLILQAVQRDLAELSSLVFRAAECDRADLESQRKKLAEFVSTYRAYRAALQGRAAIDRHPLSGKAASIHKILGAVHDILQEQGDALPLADIFEELIRRGVVVGGRNPKQNLSQKMSACAEFKSYGKVGWYFADEPPPIAIQRAMERDEDLATPVTRSIHRDGASDLPSDVPRGDRAQV